MGGVVYKSTRFGTEMAEFGAPTNPNTSAQQAARSSFKKATQQWRTLNLTQATAWRNYAAQLYTDGYITLKRYKPNGFNAFVKLAAKWYAVNASGTAPTTPPATAFSGDSITVTVDFENPGVIDFTASAPNAANVTTALLIQKVSSGIADPVEGAYKIGKYFRFIIGTLSTTVSVAPGYYAVGYQFVNTATGQTSAPIFLGVIGPVSFQMVQGGQDRKRKAA
ncbi:MAG: hypothetical protein IT363_11945 [Methanoregulaceae archaeon]|nr:hypothetical protein [Methanoregulaceae archaeon]